MSKIFKVLETIGNALCLPLVFLFVFAIEIYFKLKSAKRRHLKKKTKN